MKVNKSQSLLLAISLFIFSCSKDVETVSPALSAYNLSVVNYFKDVALGFEFGGASEITRRWTNDMKVFVGGNPTLELQAELEMIVNEINDLSTTGFTIEIVNDTLQSNYYIYFGSGSSYADIFPSQSSFVANNFGLFSIFWNGSDELFKGYMYVDIFRATLTEQKHILREELTQSLGLGNDSPLFAESIFQQDFTTKTTEYAQIDEDLIRLLYHPDMRIGLNKNQVDEVLRDILLAEQ